MKKHNDQNGNQSLMLPKRLVFEGGGEGAPEGGGTTGSGARRIEVATSAVSEPEPASTVVPTVAPPAAPEAATPAAAVERELTLEQRLEIEMGGKTIQELQALLERETTIAQAAAKKLLERLTSDDTLLRMYQLRAPQAPAARAPAPPTVAPAERGAGELVSDAWNRTSTFFQDTWSSLTGADKTPEQQAVEHKQRILDRITALVAARTISIPQENLDSVRRDIVSQYSELVGYSPQWTRENSVVAAAAIGIFLFNWWRKGSFWEATTSTLKTGVLFGVGGLAAYALKTGLPGSTPGNIGERIWNSVYVQVPVFTQYLQWEAWKARERQGPLRSQATEEVVKVHRLRNLLSHYRRNVVTIREEGPPFRSREDLAREISQQIVVLKNSSNPQVRELMRDVSDHPSDDEIDTLLGRLKDFELAEAFSGQVPGGVQNILTLKNNLLNSIERRNNDVPRSEGQVETRFKTAVENQTKKSVEKVEQMKERKNAYLQRMGLTLLSFVRGQRQQHDELVRMQTQMQRMQQEGRVAPEAVTRTIQQLSSTLGDADRAADQFQRVLSSGTEDEMFDRMIHLLNQGKDEVLAAKKTPPVANEERWEKLDALSDHWLLMEIIMHASSRIPEADLTSNDIMQLASQALVAMSGAGTLIMALGIGAAVGVASGAVRVATTPLRLVLSLARSTPTEILRDDRHFIRNWQGSMRAGTMLVSATSFGLALLHLSYAKQAYAEIVEHPGIVSNIRYGTVGVEILTSSLEIGIGYNAARRITDISRATRGARLANFRNIRGNIVAILATEAGRYLLTRTIDQLATAREFRSDISDADLFSLMAIYQDEPLGEGVFEWLKTQFSSLTDIDTATFMRTRRAMREKILGEFGRRSGLTPQDITDYMLQYYQQYADRDYNFDPNRNHNEVLTYAIIYAQVAKVGAADKAAGQNDTEAARFDTDLAGTHAGMKERLDHYRLQIETLALRAQMEVIGDVNTLTEYDPEIRFLLQSFGVDYTQIMRFYQLCRAAIVNESTTPAQRVQLEQYANYADFYIHNFIHYTGPVSQPRDQEFTYQAVEVFINGQKNLENPVNNRLLHYYAETFVRQMLDPDRVHPLGTVNVAQKQALIDDLKERGVTDANAHAFADAFFEDFIYSKGETDGLIHRRKERQHEVFLAGQWREASAERNTDWTPNDDQETRGYTFFTKVVDGVTYHYLPQFSCFVTTPPTELPDNNSKFIGQYVGGVYHEPECNINDMSTLTIVDIPQPVYNGILEALGVPTPSPSPSSP